MDIGDWLDRNAIAYRATASTKRQALAVAADLAGRTLGRDPAEILESLLEREQEGSTGIGHGVAAPHARLEGLDRLHAVFVRLESPIEFESIDDQPVDLMFALFAPVEPGSEHLRGLARISRLLQRGEVRERLRQARSADAVYSLLAQGAEPSAA